MRLTPVPVLGLLRDLWSMPRDMKRFHAYLEKVRSGPDGQVFAAIVPANPMAKPHMLDLADRLLAMGADQVLADACAGAERRLAKSPVATRVSLVPIDDVGGGWSDRASQDFQARGFGDRPKRDYGYVAALVFASEDITPGLMRERVLAACYRAAWIAKHGAPTTVRQMLEQEGAALRFAGATGPHVPDLAQVRAVLAPHLDATLHATRFATMYGDEAAKKLGHKPLGLPTDAGFALALADAPAPPEQLV